MTTGVRARRADSDVTWTSFWKPIGRPAPIPLPSNSIAQRGSRNAPTRRPPPDPVLMIRLLSYDVAPPNAPSSTVPRRCACTGDAATSAATPSAMILYDMSFSIESSWCCVSLPGGILDGDSMSRTPRPDACVLTPCGAY